ncbi:MAG: GntR family transcriptional regulator, partial [Alphaproteobacteria bacterium]|nr:GntR family transcriptional regulator [Alphaproteobacteria bacterium]
VREALRILAAEGLVTQIPNKGAYVSQLTPADVEEIFEMRLSLEAMALQHSIANMTDFHIRQAENVQLRLENAHPNEYGRLNKKFHDILYAPSERKILLSHVSSLGERADRYLRMAIKELDHGMTSNEEHRQILEACKMRDSKRAIEILQSHIRDAGEMLKRYVSDLGENDK